MSGLIIVGVAGNDAGGRGEKTKTGSHHFKRSQHFLAVLTEATPRPRRLSTCRYFSGGERRDRGQRCATETRSVTYRATTAGFVGEGDKQITQPTT